jgi:hypothetical protein
MTTGYGLDGRSSIPGRVKIFLFIVPRPALRPTQPPIQRVRGGPLFPGVKRPGCEADHSPHLVQGSRTV